LAHLGNLWGFPPLMFIFSTVKDLKYSLQRDEFPADVSNAGARLIVFNSVAGFCVSHHALLNLCV